MVQRYDDDGGAEKEGARQPGGGRGGGGGCVHRLGSAHRFDDSTVDFFDRDRVQVRVGLTPAMGGCYPQSDGQPLERRPQLAVDLLSRSEETPGRRSATRDDRISDPGVS